MSVLELKLSVEKDFQSFLRQKQNSVKQMPRIFSQNPSKSTPMSTPSLESGRGDGSEELILSFQLLFKRPRLNMFLKSMHPLKTDFVAKVLLRLIKRPTNF